MESTNEGCYLWGALLTIRDGSDGVLSEYKSFFSWNPDIAAGEIDAFLDFWEWFTELRNEADRTGGRSAPTATAREPRTGSSVVSPRGAGGKKRSRTSLDPSNGWTCSRS